MHIRTGPGGIYLPGPHFQLFNFRLELRYYGRKYLDGSKCWKYLPTYLNVLVSGVIELLKEVTWGRTDGKLYLRKRWLFFLSST